MMDLLNEHGMPTEADEERKLKADAEKAKKDGVQRALCEVAGMHEAVLQENEEQAATIERLEAACAAYRQFLKVELGWEYFRNEMSDGDDPESASGQNAQKLRDWLEANQQPGERLQIELTALLKIADAAKAVLSEIENYPKRNCVIDCLSQQCIVPPLRSALLEYHDLQKPPKTQATDNP